MHLKLFYQTNAHTHTLSLSLSLSHTHTHTHTLSLSLSLSLTHTHTHTHTQVLFTPVNSPYTKLAEECVKHGVAVEMFLTPTTYCDVATLGGLCNTTGGQLHLFHDYKVCSKQTNCLYVHVYVYMYMYCRCVACVCACVCARGHVLYMLIHVVYTCTMYIHVYTMYMYVCGYICMCTCIHVHNCTCTYVHVYLHVHVYVIEGTDFIQENACTCTPVFNDNIVKCTYYLITYYLLGISNSNLTYIYIYV